MNQTNGNEVQLLYADKGVVLLWICSNYKCEDDLKSVQFYHLCPNIFLLEGVTHKFTTVFSDNSNFRLNTLY